MRNYFKKCYHIFHFPHNFGLKAYFANIKYLSKSIHNKFRIGVANKEYDDFESYTYSIKVVQKEIR